MIALEHFWNIVEHESLPIAVGQTTTFSTYTFCDEDTTHGGRPDHSSRMELDKLHVPKFSTCPKSQCVPISSVFPRPRTNAPASSATACCQNNGLCRESVEVAIDTGVSDTTSDAVTFFQEVTNGVFHEDVNTFVNTSLLERTNDFETSSVTNVRKTWEGVASEVALIDQEFWRSVKHCTPLFEFSNSVRGFLCMEFSHAPVSKPLASLHGVMEMNLPTVTRIGVLKCCSTATFGHDGVGLAEERLGDDGGLGTTSSSFDSSTETSTASTDDNDIVFVFGICFTHLVHPTKTKAMSLMCPSATAMVQRSPRKTKPRLVQNQNPCERLNTLIRLKRRPRKAEIPLTHRSRLPPARWRRA